MKICVIGNSHLAALRQGWSTCKSDFEGIDLTFFGSTRDRMRGLVLAEGLIAPIEGDKPLLRQMTIVSGGKGFIDPSEYDAFIVYGLLFRVPALDYRWSSAVSLATCADAYQASVAHYVVSLVRSVTNKRVLVGAVPLRSARARPPKVPADTMIGYKSCAEFMRKAVVESGAEFVPQPSVTVGDGWFTRDVYAKGAVSLMSGEDVGSSDTLHMNSKFGELSIRDFLTRLI